MPSTTITAIKNALSTARMSTYELVVDGMGNQISPAQALDLYAWNAQVSAALMAPLHICEVVVRNAVADVLVAQYGDKWPWSPGFEKSLPHPPQGYSARVDLQNARRNAPTAGKVIPELKFAFWQRMFTHRHDSRLWDTYLTQVFPNLPHGQSVSQARQVLYNELEHLRRLRNRIAHHEPIFKRNLTDDFQKITDLIAARCLDTAAWMAQNQQALQLVGARPV